jgi:hypothetical protein
LPLRPSRMQSSTSKQEADPQTACGQVTIRSHGSEPL